MKNKMKNWFKRLEFLRSISKYEFKEGVGVY